MSCFATFYSGRCFAPPRNFRKKVSNIFRKKFAGAEGTKEKVPKGQQSNTKGFPWKGFGYNNPRSRNQMAAPKGSKKFFNPETGKVTIRLGHPGPPWVEGIPDHHINARGQLMWHNPSTGETVRRAEDPGPPFVRGMSPQHRENVSKNRSGNCSSPDSRKKAVETLKKRHREEGFSEKEKQRAEKLSERNRGREVSREQRDRISATLSGRKTGFNPKRSRSVSERKGCDTIYLAKIVTQGGTTFGKWGATNSQRPEDRWKELRARNCQIEIVFTHFCGPLAPAIEEQIGRDLSNFPIDLGEWRFGGHTETFEWTENTQKIVEETINALEESAPSFGKF